jgi:hypothetical protein
LDPAGASNRGQSINRRVLDEPELLTDMD